MIHKPLLILSTLLLSACSTAQGDFPSLAKRPFESKVPVSAPERTLPETAVALPPQLADQINGLENRARQADAKFTANLPAAQAAVQAATSAAIGSEAWIKAHMLLSRLDAGRGEGVSALAELDTILAQEGAREQGRAATLLTPLIKAVHARVAERIEFQNQTIDRLSRQVGQ